ncbi:MAG: phosphoribosylaminoimidazolesuccinocarboxamide synthase [bacterium]|nr:phosphoribosylaminoimidazolesuccinocarboxamide synthase [bacterium]
MPRIPERVASHEFHFDLIMAGFVRVHSGKVRDTYWRPGADWLLVVATDRVSIFDLVMPFTMDRKGEFLVAYTVLCLTEILKNIDHHLLAYGNSIDKYLNSVKLRDNIGLQKRAIVVRKEQVILIECVVRGYLTGSGWKEYQLAGEVCGNKLPDGLFDGARLPEPIFTPTIKAAEGHDDPLNVRDVDPELARRSIEAYKQGAKYALTRGIIIADTKFEWSKKLLVDEVLTPDSSRFCLEEEWKACSALRQSPPSYDKQLIRNWGLQVETPWGKLDSLDPEQEGLDPVIKEAQYAFIGQLQIPAEILQLTGVRYETILSRLSGHSLPEFQQKYMGIR